jgi:DNA ligase 1
MRLAELVDTSSRVAATPGRLAKIKMLSDLLVRLDPDEIDIAVGFLTGAPRQGRTGIGWATVQKALAEPAAAVPSLELREVDAALEQIKATSGSGSAGMRLGILRSLFARGTEPERRFLTGLLMGEIRQGALEGVMVEAVARAAKLDSRTVRRAVMMAGDLRVVARAALQEGAVGLARFAFQLFQPVHPMLAQSAESVADALTQLGRAALEYKLDGARIQVHRAGTEVKVYSRTLNDVTVAVPEVVEATLSLPVREAVLEGEAIALKPDGRPHPFQITMRRFGRKLDVQGIRGELPLTPFFFDLLYLNGDPILDRPQAERYTALRNLAAESLVVPAIVTSNVAEGEGFYQQALARGHEGVMAKAPDSPYQAGQRGRAWLKIKAAVTLDLVVLAAEWGHGRRHGWLSNLHLGARDDGKGFIMLGKTFKGMTDEMLAWQTERLLGLETGRDANTVYVRPELVVEVAFNDIQESPHYPGGLALRFARVKGYRPDKRVGEADTFATVQELYRRATGRVPPARRNS